MYDYVHKAASKRFVKAVLIGVTVDNDRVTARSAVYMLDGISARRRPLPNYSI